MTVTAEARSVSGFVAELVRTANEVERLTVGESRACFFVRRPPCAICVNELASLEVEPNTMQSSVWTTPQKSATLSDANVSAILREAADMVRTLWIVIDSGTIVSLTQSGSSSSDRS
ncbi:hypothetical protein [Rhizobium leguminosarum]|uniref:hypothetical protein n=1 Tax=Rhizobium leguminosarum TaxID=384 RepID=UPI001FDF6889|nr:hypothetical protein [Rhizobium leguminosarum]